MFHGLLLSSLKSLMRWYTLWNIRGTFVAHCSMKCCEVCNRFTCVYILRNELITNDIWWSVKDCSTKWLHIPWNILRGTLVFRPILTLNLTEISAWNMMFHGAPFNCNFLISCMLWGWFLCAGLLNKKVHFRCAVFWSKKGIFWSNRVLPGLTRHPILSCTFMKQSGKTISWSNRRMGLRGKPAMTQRMSNLESAWKDLARKSAPNWCKKQRFLLRKTDLLVQ